MAAEVSAAQQTDQSIVSLGVKNGIEMAILRRSEKTLGKIIAKPDSSDLIEGVRIEPLSVYPDDRGYFMELARPGKGLAPNMVPEGNHIRSDAFTEALEVHAVEIGR